MILLVSTYQLLNLFLHIIINQKHFSSRSSYLLYMSLLWKLNVKIFEEDNFLIFCTNVAIVVFLNCKHAFKGMQLVFYKKSFNSSYVSSICFMFFLVKLYPDIYLWIFHSQVINSCCSFSCTHNTQVGEKKGWESLVCSDSWFLMICGIILQFWPCCNRFRPDTDDSLWCLKWVVNYALEFPFCYLGC